jgi:hypothetical protein
LTLSHSMTGIYHIMMVRCTVANAGGEFSFCASGGNIEASANLLLILVLEIYMSFRVIAKLFSCIATERQP